MCIGAFCGPKEGIGSLGGVQACCNSLDMGAETDLGSSVRVVCALNC